MFGGYDKNNYPDSVELYNNQTEKWETTNLKLKESKRWFGFLGVKLADVVSGIKGRKMTDIPSKKARIGEEDFPLINNVLSPEILKKIFEWLDIKSLCYARQTCKRWKLIIDNCNIMKEALSKFSKSNKLKGSKVLVWQ